LLLNLILTNCSWGSAPSLQDLPAKHVDAKLDAKLAVTSCKSARWLLAVERAWSKKLSVVQEELSKLPPSVNPYVAPTLVRWSVQQQIPMMRRAVKLIKGLHKPADLPSSMIVEGATIKEELDFFINVAVPRLVEAGFLQVKPFLAELLIFVSRGLQIESCIDRVQSHVGPTASAEWICEFKKLWLTVLY
jgi:hypothetical protein